MRHYHRKQKIAARPVIRPRGTAEAEAKRAWMRSVADPPPSRGLVRAIQGIWRAWRALIRRF